MRCVIIGGHCAGKSLRLALLKAQLDVEFMTYDEVGKLKLKDPISMPPFTVPPEISRGKGKAKKDWGRANARK